MWVGIIIWVYDVKKSIFSSGIFLVQECRNNPLFIRKVFSITLARWSAFLNFPFLGKMIPNLSFTRGTRVERSNGCGTWACLTKLFRIKDRWSYNMSGPCLIQSEEKLYNGSDLLGLSLEAACFISWGVILFKTSIWERFIFFSVALWTSNISSKSLLELYSLL